MPRAGAYISHITVLFCTVLYILYSTLLCIPTLGHSLGLPTNTVYINKYSPYKYIYIHIYIYTYLYTLLYRIPPDIWKKNLPKNKMSIIASSGVYSSSRRLLRRLDLFGGDTK